PREKARDLVQRLYREVDIVEVGTPMLLRYGLEVVSEIKNLVGEKPIFADAKIVDAGRYETEMVLSSGADMVSVLGGASFLTLKEAKEVCEQKGAKLVVDTIDLEAPSPQRVEALWAIRPDYLVLHLPSDLAREGQSFEEAMRDSPFLQKPFSFMVAGGLRRESLPGVLRVVWPHIVVVGSAVTASPWPEREVQLLQEVLHGFCRES
ncbi:MAG: orotidine 5'-phosphate decarboxylase / HUMPS family protein, partial [Candidatus Caldatribacteriaceae bacterium]